MLLAEHGSMVSRPTLQYTSVANSTVYIKLLKPYNIIIYCRKRPSASKERPNHHLLARLRSIIRHKPSLLIQNVSTIVRPQKHFHDLSIVPSKKLVGRSIKHNIMQWKGETKGKKKLSTRRKGNPKTTMRGWIAYMRLAPPSRKEQGEIVVDEKEEEHKRGRVGMGHF